MAQKRPYIQKTAKELANLFEQNKGDVTLVKTFLAELKHRSTPSATALRRKVEVFLDESQGSQGTGQRSDSEKCQGPADSKVPPSHHIVQCKGCGTRVRVPVSHTRATYNCPKCKTRFEAEFHNGLLEVVFLVDEETPSSEERTEPLTEATARAVLGVSSSAPFQEIKAAWRKLYQQYHPDRHQGLPERLRRAAEQEMTCINEAYQVLSRATGEPF